jgi:putative ferrous iron transport protein C
MILSELRDYLRKHRRVALADLVSHFHADSDALRGMLHKWVIKGCVRKLSAEAACGTSCCKCDPALTELYEWIEKAGAG